MDPATIEQMNKLRKSLGLPLLQGGDSTAIPGNDGPQFKPKTAAEEEQASTLETREAAGYSNFQNLQAKERKRKERDERKRAIQKARDANARFQKLEGRSLGDLGEDEEEQDAKSWLRGQKKRQKEIERRRAEKLKQELLDRETQAARAYTSRDLAGVQVAHEITDFEDGTQGQVLTLQDQEIGKGNESDEADVLESADVLARDRLKEKLEAKKKIRYDIYDEDKKELLAQYDEKKRKIFTLDAQGSSVEERESRKQQLADKTQNTYSLEDIVKPEPVSDYLEIKIRKPKKSKKTNKRQRGTDDDDTFPTTGTGGDAMQIDDSATTATRTDRPVSQALTTEDEDLSKALALSRQAALKKRKLNPEDLVRQIKEAEEEQVPEDEVGIVLDDTTTFLDNLEARARDDEPRTTIKREQQNRGQTPPYHADEDSAMSDVKQEAYTVLDGNEAATLEAVTAQRKQQDLQVRNSTGLGEEQTLSGGLGATLDLLRSRGLVKDRADANKNELHRSRAAFHTQSLLRQHNTDLATKSQRAYDRTSGKLANMSQRDREMLAQQQNEARSQAESIREAARFNREYKPDVEIKYVDDEGRLMDQKAAFKHLSHQFHGKGSGKGKTEKALKKREEEGRREQRGLLDSASDRTMQGALGGVGRREKVAGVRLG